MGTGSQPQNGNGSDATPAMVGVNPALSSISRSGNYGWSSPRRTTPVEEREPRFGPVGSVVHKRSYAVEKPNGELEKWHETATRVVDGNLALVDPRYIEPGERETLIDRIFEFEMLPGGRHLAMSGKPGRQFLFNCHVAGWHQKDVSRHFIFTFDQLMQGGGVGANYSDRFLQGYPRIRSKPTLHIVCDPEHENYEEMVPFLSTEYSHLWSGCFRVPDTREGWCDALQQVIDAFWSPDEEVIVLDMSIIRPRGRRIRTFGGTSSGPAYIAEMLTKVHDLLAHRVGGRMTWDDAMTIDHLIASCVVSGNVRRSARMAMKWWSDPGIFDFITAKQREGNHWSTNISVVIDEDFFRALRHRDEHAVRVLRMVVEGMFTNGEPGFYNFSLAMEGEINDVFCTNPCGEIPLPEWGNCFAGTERLITKEYGPISFQDIAGETVTVMTPYGWKKAEANQFGEQHVRRFTFAPVRRSTGEHSGSGWQRTRSNFLVDVVATKNHRWETVYGNITRSLNIGDVIPMSAAERINATPEYDDGVRHGIIFGDGSCDRQYANGDYRHRVRLFGAKADEMAAFFEHKTYPASCNGAPEATVRSSKRLKDLPEGNEGHAYLSGFLDGWIMADGNTKPNGSVHLASSHPEAEVWLRENASFAGWVLRAARDSGTTETNFGERNNPLWFFTLARPNTPNLAWKVISIDELPEKIPVYCVTEPETQRFTLASGILTGNCNLGHVNLEAHCDPLTGQFDFTRCAEAFRLMSRFLTRATFGDVPSPLQKRVNESERRIGVGFTGFHGWLTKQGFRWSEAHHAPYIRKTLGDFYKVVRKEVRRYAFNLRIPEPVKCTTLAPVGTVSKLAGCTESMEPSKFRYFEQRIRFSKNPEDPNIADLRAQGVTIEDAIFEPNTLIAVIPCKNKLLAELEVIHGVSKAEWLLEEASEIPLDDMLAVQQMVQYEYADNAISFTVNRPPDATQQAFIAEHPDWSWTGESLPLPEPAYLEDALATIKHFLPRLKGTTVMIDGSRMQAPYTPLTKEQYESAVGHQIAESFDGECAGGACDWAGAEVKNLV